MNFDDAQNSFWTVTYHFLGWIDRLEAEEKKQVDIKPSQSL